MRKVPVILLIAGLLCGAPRWSGAQSGGTKNRQYGGTQEIFKLGGGARALGLGSAVVAMPLDASTVYWNPGGLDYLERRSVTMFYTPLLTIADVKYHYIGAAYPVLDFGTFGAGWLHWDIPGVEEREYGSVRRLASSSAVKMRFSYLLPGRFATECRSAVRSNFGANNLSAIRRAASPEISGCSIDPILAKACCKICLLGLPCKM